MKALTVSFLAATVLVSSASCFLLERGQDVVDSHKNIDFNILGSHTAAAKRAPGRLPSAPARPRTVDSGPSAGGPESAPGAADFRLAERRHGEPAWAVPFGREFWREGPTDPITNGMGRVSHALRAVGGKSPGLATPAYRVAIEENAVLFSPRGEESSPDLEIEIATAAARLGGEDLIRPDRATTDWTVVGNTAQRLLDPATGLLEHFETRSEGVEVSWILPERPAAAGDLTIELALGGVAFSAETETGLHFADASGTPRARVSPVVVVDAAGSRWDAEVAARGDRIEARVDASILAMATFPLAVDPIIGPEFGFDEPLISPVDDHQTAPAVASSGANYFVLWTERDGILGRYRATLIRATDGEILLPLGFSARSGQEPAVAYGDGVYLVLDANDNDVCATRHRASDGERLDDEPLVLADGTGAAGLPGRGAAVAFNGHEFLVVWRDRRDYESTGHNVYGARVRPDGSVLDAGGFPVNTEGANQEAVAVAALGRQFLVVWETSGANGYGEYAQIAATRVDGRLGVALDARIDIAKASPLEREPAVASNGSDYLVVWSDTRGDAGDIYGVRVTPDGAVAGSQLEICRTGGEQVQPAVASNGDGFLVAWRDHSARSVASTIVYAADGTALPVVQLGADPGIRGGTWRKDLALAGSGTDYLVAWTEMRTSDEYCDCGEIILRTDHESHDFRDDIATLDQAAAELGDALRNPLPPTRTAPPISTGDLDQAVVGLEGAIRNPFSPTEPVAPVSAVDLWNTVSGSQEETLEELQDVPGAISGDPVPVADDPTAGRPATIGIPGRRPDRFGR